ncbi:hypothetical protein E2562_013433 [Oryza meyeriana var. granulata]|uniref:Uncharacterized protein n=1 Tax=Oryza meyeriana var. granulata TaxID=110450 RepID=A0A6G1EAT6_9ORYZ|nr:hypothetical protein E2562_013433 [Oryza meyeriana var. granulata]
MDHQQEEMSPVNRDLEILEEVVRQRPGSRGFNTENQGEELNDEVDDEEGDQNGEDGDDDVVHIGSLLAGGKRKLRSKAWEARRGKVLQMARRCFCESYECQIGAKNAIVLKVASQINGIGSETIKDHPYGTMDQYSRGNGLGSER